LRVSGGRVIGIPHYRVGSAYHAGMNYATPPTLLLLFPALLFLIQVAWYVGMTVLMVKIWNKVRRLPD
jgi:hypothetical protein